MNCIQEGMIPSKYYEKYTEKLFSANGTQMKIQYELNNVHVCHENICFKIPYVLVKNMTDKVILGLPFINSLYPFLSEHDGITTDPFGQKVMIKFASKFEIDTNDSLNLINAKTKHFKFLKQEVRYKRIAKQLSNKLLQSKIDNFLQILINDVCFDIPNAFWHRKRHIVNLPYVKDFNEKNIPTKACPIQMNAETVEFYKKEIHYLIKKKLIKNSKSLWSCATFYVQKNAEIERGTPRLVFNYKPLNKVLEWIRYPIPNKNDLVHRLSDAVIFSKFDMKSGFWQVQISEEISTKLLSPFLLDIMSGMLYLLV